MTLPDERFNALRNTKQFLEDLLLNNEKYRITVKRLLKHFPELYWIDKVEKMYKDNYKKY